MNGHFRRVPGGIEVNFTPEEARFLADLPAVLAGLGDAADDPGAARLDPPVYLGDPEADSEWKRLAGTELSAARRADRSAFELIVETMRAEVGGAGDGDDREGVVISLEEAGAFLRVVNEVRLVLGARWGIDGPEDYDRLRPEAGEVFSYLGWLVTEASEVLGSALD